MTDSYDHIVIGGGSAGALIAARLSEDSECRVLLIEAGDASVDRPSMVDPALWFTNFGTAADWQYRTVEQPNANGRRFDWNRGKVLGGSSSIDAAVWVWGHPADFDAWADAGNIGWDFGSLKPIFQRLETRLHGSCDGRRGNSGRMRLTSTSDRVPLTTAFFQACKEMGHAVLDDVSGPISEGCGTYDFTVVNGQRFSVTRAFLLPSISRPNLSVLTDANVDSLIFDGTRCAGVRGEADGKLLEIRSRHDVVLSAGVMGSPRLLMRSGVGDAAELERLGLNVVANLPGVGENLHDHCLVSAFAAEAAAATKSVGARLYARTSDGIPAPDHEVIISAWSTGQSDVPVERGFSLHTALVRPQSRGRLALTSTDWDAPLLIDPGYFAEPADLAALCTAVEMCVDLAAAPALLKQRSGSVRTPPSSKVKLREFVRNNMGTYWNPVGTCSMGVDARSVVDPTLCVHGVSNLRVADSSVMPRITTGNTLAPTLVIAERAASLMTAATSA
ncbi:GMC family oxidoreductase [Paraburkholderia solisilvae]|uniref:GMC family oxidoreductase n=1 Tax=Paraburkholderia solisilvae TaxID=624376 RepID=UPI001FE5510D|nr:GMC family oxidoreductase N-terminal domain-containing protein [Paraburkholderia solisilvae]